MEHIFIWCFFFFMYTSMFQNMYVHLLLFRSVFWAPLRLSCRIFTFSKLHSLITWMMHFVKTIELQHTLHGDLCDSMFSRRRTAKKSHRKMKRPKKTEPTRQFIRKKGTKPSTSGCTQELKCTLMCKMRARTRTQANNQKTHRGTENENYKFIWFSAVFMCVCVCASLFCSLLISFVFSPDCFICWFYFPLVASFFLSFSRRTLERKEKKEANRETKRRWAKYSSFSSPTQNFQRPRKQLWIICVYIYPCDICRDGTLYKQWQRTRLSEPGGTTSRRKKSSNKRIYMQQTEDWSKSKYT